MPDREKVIKAWEAVLSRDPLDAPWDLIDETLTLLKEQEAKWIHRDDMDFIDKYNCTHFHGMCTNCGLVHDFIDRHTGQYKYCPQCGQAVKWEC